MRKGFTLIETLLYVLIIGGVVATFVSFSISITNGRNKTYVVQEVHANARHALDIISQRIRAADGVNTGSSTFDSDPGVLSLVMDTAGINPTVIDLSADNGRLRITEGVGSAVFLTSDEVNVTNLVFTDLTPSGERANIRIDMTVAFDSTATDVEFTYSKSFQTAVSVRQ